MKSGKLTLFEASAIITGYGIGGGSMAVPYLISKTNHIASLIIIAVVYIARLLLHLMVAEVTSNEDNSQVVEIAKKYLFKGSKVLTIVFLR